MFFDQLNDSEKQILMDLMMHLARIDNRFAKQEASHFLAICKKHNLEMKFDLDIPIETLCSEIMRDQSKVIIIQELIWAARIDNEYCDKEVEFVKNIMKLLGISHNKYTEIDMWVDRGIKWQEKGKKMISCIDVFL